MLKEEELAAWLKTRGITAPMSYDVLPDADPHTCVCVAVSGGVGLTTGDAFDRPVVSIMTRGNSGRVARDLALQVDAAILDAEGGFFIGPNWTVDRGRFGGAPAFVAVDDRNRVIRNASYWWEIQR